MLKEPYDAEKARVIVREMTELLALDLVRKGVVTKKITLTISYDRSSIEKIGVYDGKAVFKVTKTGLEYEGQVVRDHYGRDVPRHTHSTGNLEHWISSGRDIVAEMMRIYDRIMDTDLSVRRIGICACDIIPESAIPEEPPVQLDLFTDYEALEKKQEAERIQQEKERALQRATLQLQERFGKNAVLKGMNLMEGATTIERNGQIGGHRAGGEEP